MSFFLKAIGLSDDIPGFPFKPVAGDNGRIVHTSPLISWTLRPGTAQDDAQNKVSIFTCVLTPAATHVPKSELIKQLARNAMRGAKSLMLPGLLRCRGAVEYRNTIYIATEPCMPLLSVLESHELRSEYYGAAGSSQYANSIAYGVQCVGEALTSLHHNHLMYGNVGCHALFVLPGSGVWRLFGLELISAPEEVSHDAPGCLFRAGLRAGIIEGYHCPPEWTDSGNGADANLPEDTVTSTDAWGLAGLLYETIGITVEEAEKGKLTALSHTLSSAALRDACRQTLPRALHAGCSGITAANPRLRKSVHTFLESCAFLRDSAFVQHIHALSELLLLDPRAQLELVEEVTAVVDSFPLRPCLSLVLPKLSELVRASMKFGSANTTAAGAAAAGNGGVSVAPLVALVLKIAARTPAGADYDQYVTPILLLLYQVPDGMVRYRLLADAASYSAKVESTTLNQSLWPLYARGFQSNVPSIREGSVRGLVHIAPHLAKSLLSDAVPRALGLLQRDADGALRTNATIALHLISAHIEPPAQRAAVLLTYCRPMLKDGFAPSRVAALRTMQVAMDCLTAKQVAEGVLVSVAPLTVDATSSESRAAALALVRSSLEKLEAHHAELCTAVAARTGEEEKEEPHHAAPASSSGEGVFNGSPPSTPAAMPPASGSGVVMTSHDARGISVSAASSAGHSPVKPQTRALAAAVAVPAPVVLTANRPVTGSGWSDDGDDGDAEDDEDGWAEARTRKSTNVPTKSVVPRSVPPSGGVSRVVPITINASSSSATPLHDPSLPLAYGRAGSASPTTSVASPTGSASSSGAYNTGRAFTTPASSGPMKLRKKGGLGASRLH